MLTDVGASVGTRMGRMVAGLFVGGSSIVYSSESWNRTRVNADVADFRGFISEGSSIAYSSGGWNRNTDLTDLTDLHGCLAEAKRTDYSAAAECAD